MEKTCATKTKNATFSQTDCNYINNCTKEYIEQDKLNIKRTQDNFYAQNDTKDILYISDTEQSFTNDFKSANFTETASIPTQQAKLDSSFNCNQGIIRKVYENATDEQISSSIKIWLAHAKERMERGREHQNTID